MSHSQYTSGHFRDKSYQVNKCTCTVNQPKQVPVAQLSLTNPRDVLHHDKRQNFKTVT